MYSAHRIASVTCLRFSSRCILTQSGSACRRWPCFLPSAVKSSASSAVSVISAGSGQPQPRGGKLLKGQPDTRRRNAEPPRDLVAGHAGGLQSKHFAHLAHRRPLCWHPLPPGQKPKERTLSAPAEAPSDRRLPGRHHSGTASEIISERRATSNWIGGRHHSGFAGDFARNQQ